jgi:hypothetical protein
MRRAITTRPSLWGHHFEAGHFEAQSVLVEQPDTAPGADLVEHSVLAEQPETAPGAALVEHSLLAAQQPDFSDDTAPGAEVVAVQPLLAAQHSAFLPSTAPGAEVFWVLEQPTRTAANERAARVAKRFMFKLLKVWSA